MQTAALHATSPPIDADVAEDPISRVLDMASTDVDLDGIGQRRARAKANYLRLTEEAKAAARQAAEDGISEMELARRLKVDRMTIRSWLGKKR